MSPEIPGKQGRAYALSGEVSQRERRLQRRHATTRNEDVERL
jgi:hypothetical protein